MKTFWTFILLFLFSLKSISLLSITQTKSSENFGNGQFLCETIYINMYDSFGDGWNGATMTIYNWNNIAVWNGTMLNGSATSFNTCLFGGCYTIVVTGGSFPTEISWVIDDGTYWLADGGSNSTTPISIGSITPGCTDSNACNYIPNANCNEGCCYDDCYRFEMSDPTGTGWDGYTAHVVDNNGVLVFEATLPVGSTHIELFGCFPHPGCYQIYFTGQTDLSQIYWELATSTDPLPTYPVIASESGHGGGYFGTEISPCESGCANPDACNYSPTARQAGACCLHQCAALTTTSSNSLGWGGADYTLTNWRGEVFSYGSLYSGLNGFESLCMPDGCYTFTVDPAPWNINWYFDIGDGTSYSGDAGDSVTIQVGDLIQGCTNPSATNFNPLANCPTPCQFSCTSDLDGNGTVNVADLLLFTSEYGDDCE